MTLSRSVLFFRPWGEQRASPPCTASAPWRGMPVIGNRGKGPFPGAGVKASIWTLSPGFKPWAYPSAAGR